MNSSSDKLDLRSMPLFMSKSGTGILANVYLRLPVKFEMLNLSPRRMSPTANVTTARPIHIHFLDVFFFFDFRFGFFLSTRAALSEPLSFSLGLDTAFDFRCVGGIFSDEIFPLSKMHATSFKIWWDWRTYFTCCLKQAWQAIIKRYILAPVKKLSLPDSRN